MNWFKKEKPITNEPTVVTTINGDSVIHRMITEADIRTEAYFLWEKNGKVGSSENNNNGIFTTIFKGFMT